MATIVLYTIRSCPHCTKARALLRNNGIQFTEYDVDRDEIRWREAMALAGGKDIVPVIDIDGKIFFGAYTSKMEEELKEELRITS
jgi:glutaredoxin 3